MTMDRRRFLKVGSLAACAVGAGVIAGPVRSAALARSAAFAPQSRYAPPIPPDPAAAAAASTSKRIVLMNLHTGEDLDVEFYRDQAYVASAMAQIEHVLRDFRNGDLHPIDPGLMDYLHHVAGAVGVAPEFHVISGYRSPATNEMLHERSHGVALHSLHMQGRAIDVRINGVNCAELAATALKQKLGGVGYYRVSNFVHMDTGAWRHWRG